MQNYITSSNVNILNGTIVGIMEFQPHLNLISGENGTFKTKLLQYLKGGNSSFYQTQIPCRIQAISPKRNAERRNFQTIFQQFRQKV